ncbi:molecular chaperone [Azospirillum sp. B506]|uniref:TorD/DmsD family molecular chaperone n=1 Tax=Azospirillum sp. B506 TaxID=137721 RepID=UPI00034ADDBB|nr:molecular chaperone TorD family protein [Azospirillum sp. B506]
MSRDPMDAVPEEQDLVFVAEWLAQQFLSPPDVQQVEAARSMPGQIALRRIGDCLGQPAAADALCQLLAAGSAADVTLAVQRRHTALFEGIFRQRSVPPYASLWDGTGRLCGPAVDRMRAVLRDLDLHVQADCAEPPDHLAIQLAALAEAMRQRRTAAVADLTDQMLVWTGRFAAALIRADGLGYYGNLARFLLSLLDRIADGSATVDGGRATAAI